MNLVQVYNTSKGQNYNVGFTDRYDMVDYLRKSVSVHRQLFDSVEIYADSAGSAFLEENGIPKDCMVSFDFERIDGRFANLGKLQVHAAQSDPYIMCDIDARIDILPDWDGYDILTEMKRGKVVYTQFHALGLRPELWLICSGIIGFRDTELARRYACRAIDMIRNWPMALVDFESLWSVEELLLTNMANTENKTVYELLDGSFEHLQGGRK